MCSRRLRRLLFRRGEVVDSGEKFDSAFEQLQTAEATYGVLDRKYEAQWYELTDRIKRGLAAKQPKSVLRSLCRRRKLLTKRREQLLLQKDHLFQKRLRLEQMSLTASHAAGLKAVLSVCREMAKELDSAEVDKMMDEMGELTDIVEDSEAVLQDTSFTDLDDDELELELESIKETTDLKINRESLQRIPRVPSIDMPVAPSEIPADTQRTGLLQAHRKRALVQ